MFFYIHLKCNNGSGYFTKIALTSSGQEVCVHPSKMRARRFSSKKDAYAIASQLKAKFPCVLSYSIVE